MSSGNRIASFCASLIELFITIWFLADINFSAMIFSSSGSIFSKTVCSLESNANAGARPSSPEKGLLASSSCFSRNFQHIHRNARPREGEEISVRKNKSRKSSCKGKSSVGLKYFCTAYFGNENSLSVQLWKRHTTE